LAHNSAGDCPISVKFCTGKQNSMTLSFENSTCHTANSYIAISQWTRNSTVAERPRDASCHWIFC